VLESSISKRARVRDQRRGLDGLFEIVCQELPIWDCAGEAHFERGPKIDAARLTITRQTTRMG
jgi:hypothetical protein